jgi:hypothetical protein
MHLQVSSFAAGVMTCSWFSGHMIMKSWFVQFTSSNSDIQSTHDLLEDSIGIIPTDKARHQLRSESCTPLHQFTASISGFSCAAQSEIIRLFKSLCGQELYSNVIALLLHIQTFLVKNSLVRLIILRFSSVPAHETFKWATRPLLHLFQWNFHHQSAFNIV